MANYTPRAIARAAFSIFETNSLRMGFCAGIVGEEDFTTASGNMVSLSSGLVSETDFTIANEGTAGARLKFFPKTKMPILQIADIERAVIFSTGTTGAIYYDLYLGKEKVGSLDNTMNFSSFSIIVEGATKK